jgi:hypothetical protein
VLLWAVIGFLPQLVFRAINPTSLLLTAILLFLILPMLWSVLIHGFAWLLGSVYRRHLEEFPWAYQRHQHRHAGFALVGVHAAPRPAPPTGFAVVSAPPPAASTPASGKREIR